MANVLGLICLNCKKEYEAIPLFDGCPNCKSETFTSNLIPVYDYKKIKEKMTASIFFTPPAKGLWTFKDLLPVEEEHIVTLSEGGTPLWKSAIGREWGIENLYVKDESRNPTQSFKDRLATVSISKAKELNAKVVTASSTGNSGAATAAYAARAGLKCVIFTNESVPQTMKLLMQAYGAKVLALSESKKRWTLMKEAVETFQWFPVSNYVDPPVGSNLYGIEGYKTIAYEICADLNGNVPDAVVVPTAYGDGISGIWRGFKELFDLGVTQALPKMIAVEVMGSLKTTLERDERNIQVMERKPTLAFSIANPTGTFQALQSIKESNGQAIVVEDDELIRMRHQLAVTGVYAELSSVASLAAIKKMAASQYVKSDAVIVSLLTSTGLKDQELTQNVYTDVPVIEPNLEYLIKELPDYVSFSPTL